MVKEMFLNGKGRPFQRSRLIRFDICLGDDYIFSENYIMGIAGFSHGNGEVYSKDEPSEARYIV